MVFRRFVPISKDKVNDEKTERRQPQRWTLVMLLARVALPPKQMGFINAEQMRIDVAL